MRTSKLLILLIVFCFHNCVTKEKVTKVNLENISKMNKVSEMLDEDIFWGIIEKSLLDSKNQEKSLVTEISKLTPKEIIGFRLRTDNLLYNSYNSELCCACSLMNQGCTDDGFEYFRNWIISRGKDTYYKALENPDSLIKEKEHELYGFYEFEGFWYVALEAFKIKTGKELYDYVDYEKFKTSEGNYPNITFNWTGEKPETMKNICPNLFLEFIN